jgi:hypothetical protein
MVLGRFLAIISAILVSVGLDGFHAVDAVVDVLLVFPAVLENDVQQAEQEGDVGAGADAHVLVGLGRGAGEARVDHDHLAAVFLGVQHVQQRHRVRFSGVGADVQRALAVLHVVVRVGHGAITPGVRDARHRGGVADARLVVAVVGAPEAHELAHQVRLFVVVLGRTDEIHRVGAAGFAQRFHLRGDLFQRGVPADALVLAVDQLHRVAQAVLAVAVFAQGGTLGAVGAEVDGGVEHRLLAHPDAVFHDRVGRTAHRAVGADGALDFDLAGAVDGLAFGGPGFLHQGELGGREADTHAQARAAQEGAAVHGGQGGRQAALQVVHEAGGGARDVCTRGGFFGQQHGGLLFAQMRVVW